MVNTTAILETIEGYRTQIALLNQYIVLLNDAISRLENLENEFGRLWVDASDSHYEILDFKGTNAALYSDKTDTLMSSYSDYDKQIRSAIETMRDEINNLVERIERYKDLISELEKMLV